MQTRLATFHNFNKRLFNKPFIVLIGFWGFLETYDLVLSQLISDEFKSKFPNLFSIIQSLGLPWYLWLIIFLSIITVALYEYAYRQNLEITTLNDKIVRFEHKANLSNKSSLVLNEQNKSSSFPETFVNLILGSSTYSIEKSANVSSVTETGVGDLTINFLRPLSDRYFITTFSDTSLDSEIISQTPNSCRIKFKSAEPARAKIAFIA
jgi:hypothetical protein